MTTRTVFSGIVHGKVIDLDQPPNLPDGQPVTVVVQPTNGSALPPGEGLRRSAGAWADDAEGLDKHLEASRRQRNHGRRDIEP